MSNRLKILVDYRLVRRCLVVMVMAAVVSSPAHANPIAVRFAEGVTHGFLLVRSLAGDMIGQGEVTQVAKEGGLVESRLVFKFKDGSLHDEKVAFSQKGVFTLISYHLTQRGPLFPEQIEVFFDRGTEEYKVQTQSQKDELIEVLSSGPPSTWIKPFKQMNAGIMKDTFSHYLPLSHEIEREIWNKMKARKPEDKIILVPDDERVEDAGLEEAC